MTKSKAKSPPAPAPKAPAPTPTPAPPHPARAYVDGLEAGVARLLLQDEHGEWRSYHLPNTALPAAVKEGSWLELSARSIATPPEFESRTPELSSSDIGKNFAL